MFESYSIIEPLGNDLEDSKIERCWNGFTGKYGIHVSRITQFDPYASMSIQPVKYMLKKFSITSELPSAVWIEEALKSFINDEFSYVDNYELSNHFAPEIESVVEISDDYLQKFLEQSEWEKLTDLHLPKNDSDLEMAECIYDLLCNPEIGSAKNAKNVDKDRFVKQVIPLLLSQSRLFFIIPSCPFKDQNIFRVPYEASCVDFGEISFLIRLHNMIQALYQVHPYGGQAIILSDGHLYKNIFKVSSDDVNEYQLRLKQFRNKLNIQGDISIIDLKEMIDRANEEGEINKIVEFIKNDIKNNHCNKSYFRPLIQGMKWNMNSKELLKDISYEDAWKIIKSPRVDMKKDLIDIWDYYERLAVEAAIEYAAVNIMLKWTDLIKLFFPDSIRCTVHPKKEQFALPINYPWNGVAWSEKWPTNLKNISTVPYISLKNFEHVKQVKFHSTGYPCFFTTEQNNEIFDAAKNVLNSEGWNMDDLFGREFTIYDHSNFVDLGKTDANFIWDRKIMSEDYYTTLLEFRINHYKKYGFGVHAIFQDGKLIGQMGLQVLNEQKQQLEFVIFLNKDYISKGIGSKLLKYLLKRCKDEGIEKIYGVVRSENEAAIKLIKKFGGKQLKSISHYQQTGILYELKL